MGSQKTGFWSPCCGQRVVYTDRYQCGKCHRKLEAADFAGVVASDALRIRQGNPRWVQPDLFSLDEAE
jgi:hypothetical protein